jgi:hypothetical protein
MSRKIHSCWSLGVFRQGTRLIIITAVLAGLLCAWTACPQSTGSKSKAELGIDGRAVSLPAAWPLADVRPPPASTRAHLLNPLTNDPYAQFLPQERSVRCDVGFTNKLGFESNLDYIKLQLAKYGEFTEASHSENAAHFYNLADRVEVGLVYNHFTGGDVYQLFVTAPK